jgi:hypothetical protein
MAFVKIPIWAIIGEELPRIGTDFFLLPQISQIDRILGFAKITLRETKKSPNLRNLRQKNS